MDDHFRKFLSTHFELTRRHFVKAGMLSATALTGVTSLADQSEHAPRLQDSLVDLETWLTLPNDFQDVSRGDPKPHTLSDEDKTKVGMTRDTWKLNVVSDPDNPASVQQPREGDTAFTFADLMELAGDYAVRFPKVMTCLNIGCPLGNGIWEGVPLREIIWRTQPKENLRRVFYYGYHNDRPE